MFGFHRPSAKCREATLQLEYKKQIRRNQNRAAYSTRLSGSGSNANTDRDRGLHLIDLYHDLLELKYYIPEYVSVKDTKKKNDANHLANNLLFMRIKITKENGLNAFPNSYKPESKETDRQWIVIELCTESDMNDFLAAMQDDLRLAMYVTEQCKLSETDAQACCQSLLNDNVTQQHQAQRENALSKSTFLIGKDNDEVLLVYPFGADTKLIDSASSGLGELACVLDYENHNPGSNNYETKATDTSKGNEEMGAGVNTNEDAMGEESRAVLTFAVSTIERLEPGIYLNDTLIDFWQQWIWRNADKTSIHYFTTHFFTTLEKNDPESVKRWTEKRGVDIFTKRFIFIPINKSLHWSLCVVVNPGAIIAHREHMMEDRNSNTTNLVVEDNPFPCILFFDSLRAHAKNRFAKLVRKWLNSEWKRLHPQQVELSPFDFKSMVVYSPAIPYQNNSWDCGVYVCRYMYAMYMLRSRQFTYLEVGWFEKSDDAMFGDLITDHEAFQFDGDDIVRIRIEFMLLMERLSKKFLAWKEDINRQRLETRRSKKVGETNAATLNANTTATLDRITDN